MHKLYHQCVICNIVNIFITLVLTIVNCMYILLFINDTENKMTIYGTMDGYHGDENEIDYRQWELEERRHEEQADVWKGIPENWPGDNHEI